MTTRFRFLCLLAAIPAALFFQGTLARAQVFQALFNGVGGAISHAGSARLVEGSNGDFYGATDDCAANTDGTALKIAPCGAESSLVSLTRYA